MRMINFIFQIPIHAFNNSKIFKYQLEISRNKELTSPWLNHNLFSILGSNGAKTIREAKFSKKMDAMRKSGRSRDR